MLLLACLLALVACTRCSTVLAATGRRCIQAAGAAGQCCAAAAAGQPDHMVTQLLEGRVVAHTQHLGAGCGGAAAQAVKQARHLQPSAAAHTACRAREPVMGQRTTGGKNSLKGAHPMG